MPETDQQRQHQWREALTRLTRLAQRQPEAGEWIEDLLRRNMPAILAPAFEVAEETGDPLPEVLARVLSADTSRQAHEAVARAVSMGQTALQDLAIASLRVLLDQDIWPADEAVPVRRHALRVALAKRLAASGRLDEARDTAERALADIPDDPSSRARCIDAYDVIAHCQLVADDSLGAVDSATRALALREAANDPFRIQAEGERMLGMALLAADRIDEACRSLVNAVTRTHDSLVGARDVLFGLEDQFADGSDDVVHVVVTMGWNPNGFDDVSLDQARLDSLVTHFHHCLAELLTAVDHYGERLSDSVLIEARTALAAASPLLRRGLDDAVLRLRILRALSSGPPNLRPAISADEFDAMADDAIAAGDSKLVAFVRMTQADYLRRQEPADRTALMGALSHLSRLLASADAVAVMREAVEVAGDDPVSRGLMLHNLAQRLGDSGLPSEGFTASSQAVRLLSEAFVARSAGSPLVMAVLFETLLLRGLESESEIAFDENVVAGAEKMLNDLRREAGADLARPVSAACGLFDSAMRQGDAATAERLATAVSRLATLRPDDEAIQLAQAVVASQLLWAALTDGMLERAREWLAKVTASARNAPNMDALTAELGKCAADLSSAYWEAGDHGTAVQLVRELRAALLSEPYLATRRRELDEDQTGYIRTITSLIEQKHERTA